MSDLLFFWAENRDPGSVRRSLVTQVAFGRDEDELEDALDGRDPDYLRDRGVIVGTGAEVSAQLDRLDDAGVDRVMLQWRDVDDTDRPRTLGDAVLEAVAPGLAASVPEGVSTRVDCRERFVDVVVAVAVVDASYTPVSVSPGKTVRSVSPRGPRGTPLRAPASRPSGR